MLSAANAAVLGSKIPPLVKPNSLVSLLPENGVVTFPGTPTEKIGGRCGKEVTLSTPFAIKAENLDLAVEEESVSREVSETRLKTFSPLPLLLVAALSGGKNNVVLYST